LVSRDNLDLIGHTLHISVLLEAPALLISTMEEGRAKGVATVEGHSSINIISEFDVKVETGVVCFNDTMKIIGRNALRSFLEGYAHKPLTYMHLTKILNAADSKDAQSSGYPVSPSYGVL
jgi:hypothetical protein